MSDRIKIAGLTSDNATLLLAAAEKMGLDPSVVRTSPTDGGFYVPADVAKEAGFDAEGKPAKKAAKDAAKAAEADQSPEPEKPKPAPRKRAPRKTAPRKTAAKTAAAKPEVKE